MATYLELFTEGRENTELLKRSAVALTILASDIAQEASPAIADQEWAAQVLQNPFGHAREALAVVLALNNTATLAAIRGATDATLQTNVNQARAVLVAGRDKFNTAAP